MAYFAPYIDAAGLHIPTYTDIRDEMIAQAKAIYGNDIYLGNDSADYQWISAVALKMSDTLQAAQLAYNNRSPATAIGAGLDAIVKINGIARKDPSYSTCQVSLTGTAGAVILNGIIDINGFRWDLPTSATIGVGGSVIVSAECETIGAIFTLPTDICRIVTPTKGWTGVSVSSAAVPGQPVELDADLRSRQAISTSLPSQTLLDGTTAGIASVAGVTRYKVYENDTNVTDANGLPAHSITCVVEGGTDADIAQQIYARKGIGCYTNGTTSVETIDAYGRLTTIRFYRPSYVDIDVVINVTRLTGYVDATSATIKQAIVDYLNGLQIGDDLTNSSLWYAALAVMPNQKLPQFKITALTAAKHSQTLGTGDIVTAIYEVTRGTIANVTVNVT